MALTHKLDEVTAKVKAILVANNGTLALKHIYYGETNIAPDFPCALVEPVRRTRDLAGQASTHKWAIFFIVSVSIFFAEVSDQEVVQTNLGAKVEAVEDVLNADITLGGLVIAGWCNDTAPGVRRFGRNVFYQGTRILWTGESRHIF